MAVAIKSYVDEAKSLSRDKEREYIDRHILSRKAPEDIQVVCFPGAQSIDEIGIELEEVFDPLNIPRRNIWGIEMDPERHAILEEGNTGINLTQDPITDVEFFKNVEHHTQGRRSTFDVASLDYTCYLSPKFIHTLGFLAGGHILADRAVLCTNFLAQREGEAAQDTLEFSKLQLDVQKGIRKLMVEDNPMYRKCEAAIVDQTSDWREYVDISRFDLKEDRTDAIQQTIYCSLARGSEMLGFDWTKGFFTNESILEYYGALMAPKIEDLTGSDVELRLAVENGLKNNPGRDLLEKLSLIPKFRMKIAYSFGIQLLSVKFGHYPDQMCDLFQITRTDPYFLEDCESYSYTSNSGQRMMFDLAYVDRHLNHLTQLRPLFVTQDGTIRYNTTYSQNDLRTAASIVDQLNSRLWRAQSETIQRVDLTPSNGNISSVRNLETTVETSPISRRQPNGEEIYDAISAGMPDEEVMQEYDLTIGQVRARKAILTRRNGGTKPNRIPKPKKEPLPNYSKRDLSEEEKKGVYACLRNIEKYGITEREVLEAFRISRTQLGAYKAHITMGANDGVKLDIAQGDLEVMVEFLGSGYSTKDVRELFDCKYSLPQVCGIQAALTKGQQPNGNGLRDRTLQRDNYECQYDGCALTNTEHKQTYNHGLHMHHISGDDTEDDEHNVIMLCVGHHSMTNQRKHCDAMEQTLLTRITEIYKDAEQN